MKDKVVVITGATSGIGQAAAEALAAKGARIVQIARNRERGEASLQRLRERGPRVSHKVHYADLSLVREMRSVGAAIAAEEERIDVFINNAGVMFSDRRVTAEGLELTFAVNHMAYYVLTTALRDRLISSAPARIVCTSSDAHAAVMLDLDDLQAEKAYKSRDPLLWARFGGPGFQVYGRSKLCNILLTEELARRLEGTNVTVNCLHPGFVATRFGDEAGGLMGFALRIGKRFAISRAQGSETLVYLASSPEVAHVTGKYFYRCRPAEPSREAQERSLAIRLWEESANIANRLR